VAIGMASLRASPFPFTFTSSNSRFPFSITTIRATFSSPHRVWTRASNSMSEPSVPEDGNGVKAENSDVLVQYVVLRRDLIDTWPLGSVVAQGCHASVCAVWSQKDDPHTVEYCSPQNIDSMHKVKSLVLFLINAFHNFLRRFRLRMFQEWQILLASRNLYNMYVWVEAWLPNFTCRIWSKTFKVLIHTCFPMNQLIA
jgi:hypothetical protein